MGGMNGFAYPTNPVEWIDPLGLAECSYNISSHTLVCISNTYKDPNFVGPPEVRTIDPSAVHSGMDSGMDKHLNNPESAEIPDLGPIWPGEFNMTPNDNHPGWWALQETDWIPGVSALAYKLGWRRAGANLHPGRTSKGCITVNPSHGEQFKMLTNLLQRENGANTLRVTP
jgi:hypothetical protein